MTLTDLALKLRPLIEKAAMSLDDTDALKGVSLFPRWSSASVGYLTEDRVSYEGVLYKCLQAHTSQDTWKPTAAPSLWAKVLVPDEDVVPDWEQPDSTNAYQIGDKVRYNGKVYECTIANNVWAPDVYGWREVSV